MERKWGTRVSTTHTTLLSPVNPALSLLQVLLYPLITRASQLIHPLSICFCVITKNNIRNTTYNIYSIIKLNLIPTFLTITATLGQVHRFFFDVVRLSNLFFSPCLYFYSLCTALSLCMLDRKKQEDACMHACISSITRHTRFKY